MTKEKILVVDDEKQLLEEMKDFLTMEGYEVSVAENGQKGLQVFKEFQPDIVFMDIKMPGIDGIETFRYMKKTRPETKVILITGLPDEQTLDRAAGVAEGAVEGFIPKPFGFSEVRQCLEKIKTGAKSPSFRFTKTQIDALNKVGKAGAENASLSFSELLGEKIELSMQEVTITSLSETGLGMAESPEPMVGIMHKLSGKINGRLVVLLPWQSGFNLVRLGMAQPATGNTNKFNKGEQALLKSAGAVLTGAYLKAVNQLLQLTTQSFQSELIFETRESIIKPLREELSKASEYLFNIQTEFAMAGTNIKGCFLLLPDIDSLKQILKKLGTLQ